MFRVLISCYQKQLQSSKFKTESWIRAREFFKKILPDVTLDTLNNTSMLDELLSKRFFPTTTIETETQTQALNKALTTSKIEKCNFLSVTDLYDAYQEMLKEEPDSNHSSEGNIVANNSNTFFCSNNNTKPADSDCSKKPKNTNSNKLTC